MAIETLTVAADGTQRVPATPEDWDEWVSASATRNHVLHNPLLDWLDRFGEAHDFLRDRTDDRTDFASFITRKGVEFEAAIVRYLNDLTDVLDLGREGPGTRALGLAEDTWAATSPTPHRSSGR